MDYRMLPITSVHSRENQVRQVFDEEFIDELAASIQKDGVLVPIIVRGAKGGYEIVAGEQRWRAARKIGLKEIPVSIVNADEKKTTELALAENVKRKDLAGWEREDAIAAMWASGRYVSMKDLADALDVRAQHLKDILDARSLRHAEQLPGGASTRMITAVSSLDAETRKAILEAQEKGEMPKDIHKTGRLVTHLRKAPAKARPGLVKAHAAGDLPIETVEKVAGAVSDDIEVAQLVEAKRNLPEGEFNSIVAYVSGEKKQGRQPVVRVVVQGEVHLWNSYLNTVESARNALQILKPSKCSGWPKEQKKRLKAALLDIEEQAQAMVRSLEGF